MHWLISLAFFKRRGGGVAEYTYCIFLPIQPERGGSTQRLTGRKGFLDVIFSTKGGGGGGVPVTPSKSANDTI